MSNVTVSIVRKSIYAIAEGISVSISQHNGGTPTFEQLWASESESRKLDIYYREAVSDLERRLMEWLSETSSQFDLTQDGDNYTLNLVMNRFWPSKLEGLIKNKIQDYLVHSVTAGWLNDFDGLSVKQDYQAMAAGDMLDIRLIIYQRDFDFSESIRSVDSTGKDQPDSVTAEARVNDGTAKDDPGSISAGTRAKDGTTKDDPESISAGTRAEDGAAKDDPESISAGTRAEDGTTKDDPGSISAGTRAEDGTTKDMPSSMHADQRSYDTSKDMPNGRVETGFRKKDDVKKDDNDNIPFLCRPSMKRHRDEAPVTRHSDYTDMSGTDYGRYGCGMQRPFRRPDFGMGATPPPEHRPETFQHHHDHKPLPPEKEPHVYPEPPTHILVPHHPNRPEPKEPPFRADGIDWDDAEQYDMKEEERFINSHDCGQHDCGIREGESLDWGITDNDNSDINNNTEDYEQH